MHYGEGRFGWLIIEGQKDNTEVFGEHIQEIKFEPEIDEKVIRGYNEIKEDNIEEIKYGI